jgi:hypothetical protein
LIELAEMSIDAVNAAIADGKARSGINDLAGWVVALLRTHRDYGWKISPPAPRSDSPEALREAFARYAAEQEAERHAGLPAEQPGFLPSPPAMLNPPMALPRLWNKVQEVMQAQVTRVEFNTWIRCAVLHNVDQGVATITVPSALVKEVIESRYLAALRDLLTMRVGEPIEVRVILDPSMLQDGVGSASTPPPLPPLALTVPPAAPAVDLDSCPSWISVEQWVVLPVMLRVALIGSSVIAGEVHGKSPYLTRLLRTRYRREVGELIAAVRPVVPDQEVERGV